MPESSNIILSFNILKYQLIIMMQNYVYPYGNLRFCYITPKLTTKLSDVII